MNRLELFVEGCRAGRWRWRTWRASLFAVSVMPETGKHERYDITYRADGAYWWTGDAWEKVDDHNEFSALYDNRELANFPANSVPNHPEPIQTTYGRMLFNHMVVCFAFGSKIPFFHKGMPKAIVAQFVDKVIDDDAPEPTDGSQFFRASEVARFVQALNEITSICGIISPTGTDKSLTTDPRIPKLRAALMTKYKDDMTPANITHMQNELIAVDKEWLKDDDAADFYLGGSAYSVKRKKMFLMHGMESAFQEGGNFDFIEKSLSEGGDLTKLSAKNNSTREGSFDRGSDTAHGGEKVVFLQRIHQNTSVHEGDCGAMSQPKLITEYNKRHYVGMNIMVDGKVTPFTKALADANLGKVVQLRRPILCKGLGTQTTYCASCTSLMLAKNPRRIISLIATVASNIMLAFMSSMHGNELAVSRYNFKNHIK